MTTEGGFSVFSVLDKMKESVRSVSLRAVGELVILLTVRAEGMHALKVSAASHGSPSDRLLYIRCNLGHLSYRDEILNNEVQVFV